MTTYNIPLSILAASIGIALLIGTPLRRRVVRFRLRREARRWERVMKHYRMAQRNEDEAA